MLIVRRCFRSLQLTSWTSASHPPSKSMAWVPPRNCSAAIDGVASATVRAVLVHHACRIAEIDELQPRRRRPAASSSSRAAAVLPDGARASRSAGRATPADRRCAPAPARTNPPASARERSAMHQSSPRQANGRTSSNPSTRLKAGRGMSAGGRISLDDSDRQIVAQAGAGNCACGSARRSGV